MNQDPQLERIIKRIQSAMVALEDASPETARKALRNLFDEIISEFEGQPGMQTIVLSIASGDTGIRKGMIPMSSSMNGTLGWKRGICSPIR